jgi:2',3'-cyclic-nucleotide 2'-phosphodiesterase (5'-nucleotidase family)
MPLKDLKHYSKNNSMRRFLVSLLAILTLFSCSRYLAINQINTSSNSLIDSSAGVDSVIESFVKPFRDSINIDMKKIVGITAAPLIKGKPESKLTNLVADVVLKYGTDYCNQKGLNIHPDASYVNYGGLRASLPQGEITVGHIFELMPFENEIVLVKISGEAVQKMAEKIAARGGEGVAGLKLGIQDEALKTLVIKGKNIDKDAAYWLVTNDYIANGGDQMNMFLNPMEKIETKLKIRDVLIQSLREMYKQDGIIDVKLDGRIYNEQ